jgi:hypothetical protein
MGDIIITEFVFVSSEFFVTADVYSVFSYYFCTDNEIDSLRVFSSYYFYIS